MLVFRSLASGSSGNAYLLRTGKTTLLFDAGLPIKRMLRALASEDVEPRQIAGILMSHEHRDHCAGARDLAEAHDISIWANAEALRAAGLHDCEQSVLLDPGRPISFGDVEVTSFPVSHDAAAPVGFLIRTANRTITIATDLGQTDATLAEAVSVSDLVVLEANHDLEMLHRGRYPYHLRRRVSGITGHLSNAQAASFLSAHLKGPDVEIWLAHLSKENNTTSLATRTVKRALTIAGIGNPAIGVALRDKPSLRWTGAVRPTQLSLLTTEAS
jgi:phosphoribosyl 1,2-cyclic phosphodiesterase